MEEVPASAFDLESVYRREVSTRWYPVSESLWRTADGAPLPSDSSGLPLAADDLRRGTVWREVAVDAQGLAGIDVETTTRPAKLFKLYWAPPGEPFTAERSLEASAPVERPDGTFASWFPTWRHPEWRGRVGRIRLTVAVPAAHDRLHIRSVEGVRLVLDDDALRQAESAPRLLELDRELRPGFLTTGGEPLSWHVEIAPADRLSFGYGLLALEGGAATFRVRAGTPNGPPIFETRITGAEDPNRWHDAQLSVGRADGEGLRFECEGEAAPGRPMPVCLWSGPELDAGASTSHRPNLLLVSLDTVRPDHLSLYGYARPTTPNLERWAAEATVFETAVTTAPWTLPAHLSLLTGLDALHHGVNHRSRAPEELDLLPERLRAAGYHTAAITGGGYLDPQFGLAQGFDSYRYYPERAGEDELARNVKAAIEWLGQAPREPWFLFFHTYEPHFPYHPREPFLDRLAGRPETGLEDLAYVTTGLDLEHAFVLSKQWRLRGADGIERELSADELRRLVDLYDSGLAYTDHEVAKVLAAAERVGNPATVVTSDHGEALGEHGLAGHAYLWDVNALVPLVIKRPRRQGPQRIATQVRITDVAPTLLGLAGLDPAEGIDGVSLEPLLDGTEARDREATIYASFSNRGLALRLGGRTKLLFDNTAWESLWGRRALYHPATDKDETEEGTGETIPEALEGRALSIASEVQGALRITLGNISAAPLDGSLQGPALQPARLSSSRLPTGALRWVSPRRALLHLTAGDSCVLFLENPPGSALHLELTSGLDLQLDLGALGDGVERWLVDGVWSADRPNAKEPSAGLSIAWTSLPSVSRDPGEEDAELREQLRALGYIE